MIQKLKTLIVDDEISGRENLEYLLEHFCPRVVVDDVANTLDETEKLISTKKFDLVFLDVQLGTSTIFELLQRLKTIPFEIIFVSAYNHALKAFEFAAIDYLLKPIKIESLIKAVDLAFDRVNNNILSEQAKSILSKLEQRNNSKTIPIPVSDGYEIIDVDAIMYCTADGSYTKIFVRDRGKILVSQSLKHYEELLLRFSFLRIHNSTIINSNYVKQVSRADGGFVTMQDGKVFSISKSRKEASFKKLLLQ
ncbi:LytR/AlgR family response regulator transcription factor [Aquimarina celericrescens]|uniref:LytR/AlgR family response regulator transcription factor n=1 Tax=Aquimarina celericrescens TaxID=1964542 RepID=A0ABW5B4Q1_9FLAO|nr:response regulator transcription factor [Aquimarina celericrescens]